MKWKDGTQKQPERFYLHLIEDFQLTLRQKRRGVSIGEGKWLEDTKNIIDTHNASLQPVHASEPINLGQIIRARLERLAADLPAVADVLKTEAVALESLVNESRAAHASEPLTEQDLDLIVGALDSLGVALADENHRWSEGEKTIYEEAIKVLWNQFNKVKAIPQQKG